LEITPKIKYLILYFKTDGILINLFIQKYINIIFIKGKKIISENFVYINNYLINFYLKISPAILFYLLTTNNLFPNKLIKKRIQQNLQFIPILTSFYSSIKKSIKLININSVKIKKFKKFIFTILYNLIQNINLNCLINKEFSIKNKHIIQNKKYLNYRW
jgi:hypothetical protein